LEICSVSEHCLASDEVYKIFVLSQNEMFGSQNVVLPQHEVYKIFILLQSEMFRSQNVVLPQEEVLLITVSLRIPTILNPVGVPDLVQEGQGRQCGFSLCAAPSLNFLCLNL
jgi:hypothetical protein